MDNFVKIYVIVEKNTLCFYRVFFYERVTFVLNFKFSV